ncbi:MAG TPA: metallophosphoesterase [Spirochaetota bacterium]|nr:metallophosphoesterase [Spirochaetota bacterium]HPI87715.1 metallophosphoesterase [Spirochaetota bacterium]HPR48160.1 metallophosphoesterase [Spirochaetota bacterium]
MNSSRINYGAALLAAAVLLAGFVSCSRSSRFYPAGKLHPETFPFRAGPFVQLVENTGADKGGRTASYEVWWFDPAPAADAVLCHGSSPDRESMARVPELPGGDGLKHRVIVNNIEKGGRCYYRITGFSDAVYSFNALPEGGVPVRILCMGDTENTASDRETLSYFSEVLQSARLFYGREKVPHCMLHLGDMVKFGYDHRGWNDFFSDMNDYAPRVPFVPVLGNHELKGDNGAHFDYFFSAPRYCSYDLNDVHVLVLHPFDGLAFSENGPLVVSSLRQYQFAKSDLEKNRDRKWIVVAIHIPLLSTGDFGMNRMLISQYFSLFRKNRVDLVLSGHDHMFDSFHVDRDESWGGTWYLVCGTGGSRLDSYIMTRKKNRWTDWFHDRDAQGGLYQSDPHASLYHVYGELSWGFTDLEFTGDEMVISYYRMLSFPRFLDITGQDAGMWKIVPLPSSVDNTSGRNGVELVKRFSKKRNFNLPFSETKK